MCTSRLTMEKKMSSSPSQ
uniref:Uncharacterized protein n=1 Tax=Arundo donax TaxID=35708 RepID=A0A0A8Z7J6_ARUDO